MAGILSVLVGGWVLAVTVAPTATAAERVVLSKGQTVYVAAYSYVLMGERKLRYPLASTLVVRNIDPVHPIILRSVEYRDSKGEHLRPYLEGPRVVAPLASAEFVVKESDTTGGHSPSFIVRWTAEMAVNAPVLETLMIGGRGGQGISFVGRAWVIDEAGD
jgi:hypothetical protein